MIDKTQTTRAAQSDLLAQRRAHIGKVGQTYPTRISPRNTGSMTVVRYDPDSGHYYGKGGVPWVLVDGEMRMPEECKHV